MTECDLRVGKYEGGNNLNNRKLVVRGRSILVVSNKRRLCVEEDRLQASTAQTGVG